MSKKSEKPPPDQIANDNGLAPNKRAERYDPTEFDELIERKLSEEKEEDEYDADVIICHVY